MQYDITIDFGRDEEFHYAVSVEPTREAIAEAQAWLDTQLPPGPIVMRARPHWRSTAPSSA
jgi:hypothetical protein